MTRASTTALVAALAACGGGNTAPDAASRDAATADAAPDAPGPVFVPGDPIVLAATPGNDEDPAVLLARDGSVYVAWFSEDAGVDILISRTTDGLTWSPPRHVSTGPGADFAPSLYQDAGGTIHAVWSRLDPGEPGHVVHNRSMTPDDGLAWDPTTEVEVTSAAGTDDWVPSVAADASGAMVVAFARNTCPPPDECYGIYTSTSTGGATWTAAAPVVVAGGGAEHHLPTVLAVAGELQLVWDPFDEPFDTPWQDLATGAHVETMRFLAGAGWTDRRVVTPRNPADVTLFPTLYLDHAGAGHVAWLAVDAAGIMVLDVPLADPAATPIALPITGYSPKIVATPAPGVYFAAWVEGPVDERNIVVRVF